MGILKTLAAYEGGGSGVGISDGGGSHADPTQELWSSEQRRHLDSWEAL